MNNLTQLTKAIRDAVEDGVTDALFTSGYLQTCLNCVKFQEDKEICIAANARPPARVIAFGCESFMEAPDEPVAPPVSVSKTLIPPRPVVTPPKPRPRINFDDIDDDIPF